MSETGRGTGAARASEAPATVMSLTPPPLDAAPTGAGKRVTAGPDSTESATVSGLEVCHVREIPARPGRTAPWPEWLAPGSAVRASVEGLGIAALWEHQSVAASTLATCRHLVLTTGTASGKSLCYLLPIAAAELGAAVAAPGLGSDTAAIGAADTAGTGPAGGPGTVAGDRPGDAAIRWRRRPATSLYLAPSKALAHDQARVCAELGLPGWRVAVVDGDTDPADRQWARDHAHHILTNPDLVHASLLPQHQRWASFLRSLRYVVVDESHRYRGVFGAQVAAVLRRLRRIAAHYGADPTFAVLSATAPDPVEAASALTGIAADELVSVQTDHSPRGRIRISLARSTDLPTEEAAATELAARVRRGEQVVAFVPSRRLAEQVARTAAAHVGASGEQIVAYRAGYLAADRRRIERALSTGVVRGVAATNALELGVDVAGLDAVVLCGYPGSRAAFWQQIGRAGRRGGPADVVLIARPRPLDAYLLDHPEALFDQPVERPVLDPASPPVLGPQLAAAAQEQPLRPGDERWFGTTTWSLVTRLTDRGILRRRPDGWYWTATRRAVDRINLRTADAQSLDIVEEDTGRVLGTVGVAAADLVVHPGAVYLHQGETFLCGDTDLASLEVYVHAARPGYLTQALTDVDVRPGPAEHQRRCGQSLVTVGPAQVRSTVTGFLRRDELTGQVWDSTPLDCPERVLTTTAMVLSIPSGTIEPSTAPGGQSAPGRRSAPGSTAGSTRTPRVGSTADTALLATPGSIPDPATGPTPEPTDLSATGSVSGSTALTTAESSRSRRDAGVHALEHLLGGLLPALVANDRS
ncbi:MAG TPA: DEAD/DEAH box helicase, partial [Microlunatus sp.]|nr:DEAD/DEAH box helicase [Microlunatus sp.]